jgi:hypothetical protein
LTKLTPRASLAISVLLLLAAAAACLLLQRHPAAETAPDPASAEAYARR